MLSILKILLLFFLLFNISVQAFPIPKNNKAEFDIIRKVKKIGNYTILFSKEIDNLIIETNIEIEVKILFVTAYKFFHTSKEVWGNEKFISIEGYTDFEDEREYYIKAESKDDFLYASGMDGELKLEKNIIPSNYWNQEVMYQSEIFDTQKGIIRKLDVREDGNEKININGKDYSCLKFILNATKHPKDKGLFPEYTLWYTQNKELIKFKFRNWKDKQIVEIVRKQ